MVDQPTVTESGLASDAPVVVSDESDILDVDPELLGLLPELQSTVLGGLISVLDDPSTLSSRMAEAQSKLSDEHMEGPFFQIWRIVVRYYPLTGGLPTPRALDELLESAVNLTVTEKVKLSQMYVTFEAEDISIVQFRLALVRLVERWRDSKYSSILSQAQRIHMESVTIKDELLSGYDDSQEYLRSEIAFLDVKSTAGEGSEGDINTEVVDFLRSYVKAKDGESVGIKTGLVELDAATHGMHPGELWLIAGFCQPAGELVWAESGLKPIEQLRVGDAIYGNGVVESIYHFNAKPTVNIKIEALPEKILTVDHPVDIYRPEVVTKRLCWPGCTQKHTHKEWKRLTVRAGDLRRHDAVLIPIPDGGEVPNPLHIRLYRSGDRRQREVEIPFNEDFAKFLAMYLSDGHLSKAGRAGLAVTSISFGRRTMPLTAWLGEYLDKLSLLWGKVVTRTGCRVDIYSAQLAQWINSQFSKGARSKRIPGWMLRLPIYLTQAFLDGYTDGGYSNMDRRGRSWVSTNKQMIESIVLMNAKVCSSGSMRHVYASSSSFAEVGSVHYRFQITGMQDRLKWLVPGFMLSQVKKVKASRALPVIGLQTTTGWYNTPFRVHNTSEGKSKIVSNIAYSACYLEGKNVLFATNEATRDQVRRNLVVRHSHHPKFNHPRGLMYTNVRMGTLSVEDEGVLKAVLQDMRPQQGVDSGKMFVFQLPSSARLDYITNMLERQTRLYKVDLLVIDYIGLLSAARRVTKREELEDILKGTKKLAIEYNIPIISPWQIRREAWEEALRSGYYRKTALADTSEAERSTDLIMSILKKDDTPDSLHCQILKNRDGTAGIDFELFTDFATSFVSSDESRANILE